MKRVSFSMEVKVGKSVEKVKKINQRCIISKLVKHSIGKQGRKEKRKSTGRTTIKA